MSADGSDTALLVSQTSINSHTFVCAVEPVQLHCFNVCGMRIFTELSKYRHTYFFYLKGQNLIVMILVEHRCVIMY